MTERAPLSRRIAAAVLGVERTGRGVEDIAARRELPFGRRLLSAVLGVRVTAGARQVSAPVPISARTQVPTPTQAHDEATAVSPAPARTSAAKPTRRPSVHRLAEPSVRESPGRERQERRVAAGAEGPLRSPPGRAPRVSYGGTAGVPQHLHSEDREDYVRIVDEALRSAPQRPELAAVGQRLNPEQLRTMALNATALITAAAATEYQHYVYVREDARRPAPYSSPSAREPGSDAGLATTIGEVSEVSEPSGAGAFAVFAVLAPVLSGTAAAIFLLVGYVLKTLDPERAVGRTLLTVGWFFGGVTAGAILIAVVGLLLTALRNSPPPDTGPYGELTEDVARAREAWHEALLERGLLPFLREALADPGTASAPRREPPSAAAGRIPSLGYDRPGLTHPDDGPVRGPRPSFTSPDYTSPDYAGPDFGGPEHQPE
jgi:hypothetical protein